jgi:hypothetical protein
LFFGDGMVYRVKSVGKVVGGASRLRFAGFGFRELRAPVGALADQRQPGEREQEDGAGEQAERDRTPMISMIHTSTTELFTS